MIRRLCAIGSHEWMGGGALYGDAAFTGMMTSALVFEPAADGLVVRMSGDPPPPVSEWTARGEASSGVGPLIRLREDGGAVERDGGRALTVAWPSVAGLTSDELRLVGLPDVVPFALEVVASGAIHDAYFEIHYGFVHAGRRVVGVHREGAWVRAGDEDFLLPEPLYSIAEAIDRFSVAEDGDLEGRMLRWGRIAEMLPDDALVDGRLRALNIVVASGFELHPFIDDDGEPNFDPMIGRWETRLTDVGEEDREFSLSLPAERQQEFARRFRALSAVKHRYAAGGGAYVVLTPELERALRAVRSAQAGNAGERREFLRDVSGYLRGALDDAGGGEIDVDSVFSDVGLSERIRGVGAWTDKALPWIKMGAALLRGQTRPSF